MTKTQYKRAIRIIVKGCKAKGWLQNAIGDRCAIGELLHACGVRGLHRPTPTPEERLLLWQEFGISHNALEEIMVANDEAQQEFDNEKTLCNRRKGVVNVLKGCVSETQPVESSCSPVESNCETSNT